MGRTDGARRRRLAAGRPDDVGAEFYWMPVETAQGQIRTTHVDAVAQFRPWGGHGFFLKGGAGTAFVCNWVDPIGPDAIDSKALSIVIGGGWLVRPTERVTFEAFAMQHATALGDLKTATADVPDVMGNLWSLGVALVIRPGPRLSQVLTFASG